MYLRNVTGEPGKGQTQIYNRFEKTIGVAWRGTTAQNVLDAEKKWMKDMEEVIRQEERERQNESTGVNRARSGGTLVGGQALQHVLGRDRRLSNGICKLI